MGATTKIGRAFALLFPGIITSVYVDYPLLEQMLDRLLDLNFVCAWAHAENVFVLLFAKQRRFLRQGSSLDGIVRLVHVYRTGAFGEFGLVLSASFSSALCVTKILWKASNCSVLT